MHKIVAVTLLMLSCAACKTIDLGKEPPPAERLVCAPLPEAPDLSPLQAFQTADGVMVYHKAEVDARDVPIALYVVDLRGAYFSCSNQVGWHRDYWKD